MKIVQIDFDGVCIIEKINTYIKRNKVKKENIISINNRDYGNMTLFYIEDKEKRKKPVSSKYIFSKDIDYQMLDLKEIKGQKVVDFDLFEDPIEGDELSIFLENGKVEITYNPIMKQIMIQSD